MKPYLFPFAFLIMITIYSCKEQSDNNIKKEYALMLDTGVNNPRNSEGDFISLKNGRILFIYSHYTGSSADDHANAFLAGRYSDDKGRTWTSEDAVIVEQEGKMNIMSVSLLRLQNGEIALFYLKKNSDSDCIPMLRISTDEALTWQYPIRCISRDGYFVLNNSRVIQLKDGRLLLSVALHKSPGDTVFASRGRIWSYFSDDNGRTWRESSEVQNPDSVILQEPGLIELKNGDVMMYMRTMSGVQYQSYSGDRGQSWSRAEKSNIVSPCSPASITRIPETNDLLLVWNENGKDQKRTPLNLALSEDEGKTWIKKKIIESDPEGSYCYPAIHYLDKEVLISYFNWSTRGSAIIRIRNRDLYN